MKIIQCFQPNSTHYHHVLPVHYWYSPCLQPIYLATQNPPLPPFTTGDDVLHTIIYMRLGSHTLQQQFCCKHMHQSWHRGECVSSLVWNFICI